ncbi:MULTISPECIES: LysR family transcriptional regulator [Bradyrhizobium]|uniref:LysR family transcriptional regulator n=1 Tax=Bradyrhizobium elkanii TaxID=29448 RepID=UPI000480E6C6|nr:LysR family transcriptional regulator [Bradyrhizobium elkanii]
MDRFEAMSMLLAAVEKGSLSAGAREMGVAIPTLSRKVGELETLLGAQLLTRTTRKLSLTDAGMAYVAAARRILDQVEEAEREAAGEFKSPKGELVVTSSVLFGHLYLLPIVSDFLAAFPDINIRMVLGDRNTDLVDDHIDMAVRFGDLPDSDMVATRLGSMRSITCGSPALLKKHGRPDTPSDLERFPCVSTDGPMLSPMWQFRDPTSLTSFEIRITPRLQVSAALSAVEAAVQGVGLVRLLHYQAVELLEANKLEPVLEAFEPEPEPVHIVHVPRTQMPLKLRRFIDHAAPRLRASLVRLGQASVQPD